MVDSGQYVILELGDGDIVVLELFVMLILRLVKLILRIVMLILFVLFIGVMLIVMLMKFDRVVGQAALLTLLGQHYSSMLKWCRSLKPILR